MTVGKLLQSLHTNKYTCDTNIYLTISGSYVFQLVATLRELKTKYRIFRPITCALSIHKGSEIVKNEHARYTLERFPTDNARVICTKKGIGKYGIMY